MKVTINFNGDLKMSSYWKEFNEEDVFDFIRYTRSGLYLLRDKNGREVPLKKRNVEFPEKYLDVYVNRYSLIEIIGDMPHSDLCASWFDQPCNCIRGKLFSLAKVKQ